jgi:hypothetical protein
MIEYTALEETEPPDGIEGGFVSTDTKAALQAPVIPNQEKIRAHSILWAREVEQCILKMTPIAQRHAELLIENGYTRIEALTITQGAVRKAFELASDRASDNLYQNILVLYDGMEPTARELQSVQKEGE